MDYKSEREFLASTFQSYVTTEAKILEEYRALSKQLGDSTCGLLVNHILTEEEMHHLLFSTAAMWLKEHTSTEYSPLPAGANKSGILQMTRTLREHESKTIESFHKLKAQLPAGEAELVGTLLDIVILDSEKHCQVLDGMEKVLTA